MKPTHFPDFAVMRVPALPAPASDYNGQWRRTVEGIFWSDGLEWRRIDAPGVFVPITQTDYDALSPEEQDDPAKLYVIVDDATGLRPTTVWDEVTAEPGSPDPNTLYVINPP